MNEYKKFITEKNKLNNEVKDFYNKLLFRKLKFRRFTRTKQSEENLLNEIENKFLTKEEQKNNKKILLFTITLYSHKVILLFIHKFPFIS